MNSCLKICVYCSEAEAVKLFDEIQSGLEEKLAAVGGGKVIRQIESTHQLGLPSQQSEPLQESPAPAQAR